MPASTSRSSSPLGENRAARLLVGNAALLVPPMVPIAVMLSRRGQWNGRQAVFWAAITAWPVLWLAGQIGWSIDEVVRGVPLPWFKWPIILQLCGSALPLIALVAWPHRGRILKPRAPPRSTSRSSCSSQAFCTWSLIIAPGTDPLRAPTACGRWRRLGRSCGWRRLAACSGRHGRPGTARGRRSTRGWPWGWPSRSSCSWVCRC